MKEVLIVYTKFDTQLVEEHLNKYLKLLPGWIQLESNKYYKWQDRQSYIFGKIILLQGLEIIGCNGGELHNIKIGEYGKPYLKNDVEFNISHSGGYVVCALGFDITIGIDIELITKINFKEFANVMNEKQWKEINKSFNPLHTFYRYWTSKESIMKADGRGFGINPKNISISKATGKFDNDLWFLQNFHISDKICGYLATNQQNVSLDLKEIKLFGENIEY